MATLSGLSSPFQPGSSSTRVNTAQLVNNYAGANVRVTSWLEQYLKQQQEEAAEKKAAEEAAAAAEQAAAEQAAAEQAAFEAQKQAYKDDADFVFEESFDTPGYSVQKFDGSSAINPANGEPVNWFLDVEGDHQGDHWKTGEGNDVIYHKGRGAVSSGGGDDVVYLTEGDTDGPIDTALQHAWLGDGDDKVFGGDGSQHARGNWGDDFFDLGNGFDVAYGGTGSDEFVIDLQNAGADLIVDFVDAGDKITILNGGLAAQDGDWYLGASDIYNGASTWYYDDSLGMPQQFHEIWSADGQLTAVFGIGTSQSTEPKTYALTASMTAQGIEILTSEKLADNETPGSLDFI